MDIPYIIEEYGAEDIAQVIADANSQLGSHMTLTGISFERTESNPESKIDEFAVYMEAILDHPYINITFEYIVVGEDVFMGGDIDSWTESLIDKYRAATGRTVNSAIRIPKRKVMAAEVDFDDTHTDFIDNIDDISDKVDDMKDQIDDVDEDELGIEIDNNIANHFIAECDRCQGVFISALMESNQEIEHISGVCPLCKKKTKQYLNWVIKSIDEVETL